MRIYKSKVTLQAKVKKQMSWPNNNRLQIDNKSPVMQQIMSGKRGMPKTIAGLVAPLKMGSMKNSLVNGVA